MSRGELRASGSKPYSNLFAILCGGGSLSLVGTLHQCLRGGAYIRQYGLRTSNVDGDQKDGGDSRGS